MTESSRYIRTSDPRIDESRIGSWMGIFSTEKEDEGVIQADIANLTQRVETLTNLTGQHQVDLLARPQKWTTQIRDLGDEGYTLVEPALILIEEYPGDEVVFARFPELEIFGEGVTDSEAIASLKQEILDLYDELTETDPDLLGDLPRAWLRVLKRIISRA